MKGIQRENFSQKGVGFDEGSATEKVVESSPLVIVTLRS